VQYKPDNSLIQSIFNEIGADQLELADKEAKVLLKAFNKFSKEHVEKETYKQMSKITDDNKNLLASQINMMDKFNEEFGIDIERKIDAATLFGGSKRPLDIRSMRMYKEFLLMPPDSDDEFESHSVQQNEFDEVLEYCQDTVLDSLSTRREKSLKFAIETFNKI
jgi:hypothetical protein